MTMSEEEYRQVDALINRAAGSVHTPADLIDYDDLVQELWDFWLTKTKLHEYHEGAQYKILRRKAKDIAAKERVEYAYFTGAYVYTPNQVRRLLAEAVWVSPEDSPDIDGRADIGRAIRTLSGRDQALLQDAYGLHMRSSMSKAQQRAVHRAVDKLTAALNKATPQQATDPDEASRTI